MFVLISAISEAIKTSAEMGCAANGAELVEYLAKLGRVHEPGKVFNYNMGETNFVGELLRAAIGNNTSG